MAATLPQPAAATPPPIGGGLFYFCQRCNRPLKNHESMRIGMGPTCAAKATARIAIRQRGPESDYRVVKVNTEQRIVWIVDYDDSRSVTNDAEAVVAALQPEYPGFRVIYRDTDGNWDELKHDGGRFIGFAPARELAPQ